MFVFVFLCSVTLCSPLRRADHSSKGVLPRVLIRLRNIGCEATKVLKRTVEPQMMLMMMTRRTPRSLNRAQIGKTE
jgi:hypothetical protein